MKKEIKKIYRSVLHLGCGGEIVIVAAEKNDAVMACKKCMQTWETSTQWIPYPQKMGIAEDMYISGANPTKE